MISRGKVAGTRREIRIVWRELAATQREMATLRP